MSTHHFVCFGPVRGECGVRHRTPGAAYRHLVRDISACRNLPGGRSYSDRAVWLVTDTDTATPRYHRPDPVGPGFGEVGCTWSDLMGW